MDNGQKTGTLYRAMPEADAKKSNSYVSHVLTARQKTIPNYYTCTNSTDPDQTVPTQEQTDQGLH